MLSINAAYIAGIVLLCHFVHMKCRIIITLVSANYVTKDNSFNLRIVAEIWEKNSNKIKELENGIIAKIWSIIISSLATTQ